ncbi:hypothetical protein BS78_K334400 [Paspalum vaginatum]|uniref:RING-type domain-containing protein n=1 Tax=Paspalum vaginatum TaxID=158149 RepID=A0A9W7XDQ6_9POAL|nr:hypothetical protein BS78_K334400 [Paspalum vaginatum]
MASGYYRNSSPSHDDRLYAVAVVVSASVVFSVLLHACRYCRHRLNKEAQEAEAAGLHRAPAPSSSGGGGDSTTVGHRQQQPPAPARVTVEEEMALRSSSAEPVLCTYRKAEGWAEATCAVCLAELADGVTVRVLPVCMHYFHAACVGEWLLAHHSCPLCRAPLDPPAVVVAATRHTPSSTM